MVPRQKSSRFFMMMLPACFARVKPVSTMANPACMNQTRMAPIKNQTPVDPKMVIKLPPKVFHILKKCIYREGAALVHTPRLRGRARPSRGRLVDTEEQISVRREGPSLLVGQALRLVRRGAQPLHDGQHFFGKEGSLRRRLRHRLRLG